MKVSLFTDYALRVLIHLAAHDDGSASIAEIAACYDISRHHLTKVVHDLGRSGFVITTRGRTGGVKLARPARDIVLGALVRQTEGDLRLVDCSQCLIAPGCGLPRVLAEATRAFLAVLDRYTLADVAGDPAMMRALFDSAVR